MRIRSFVWTRLALPKDDANGEIGNYKYIKKTDDDDAATMLY